MPDVKKLARPVPVTGPMKPTTPSVHRWSGWPGAFCLNCGQEDGMELAIGSGDYDPYTEKWRSPEVEADYRRRYPRDCPGPAPTQQPRA